MTPARLVPAAAALFALGGIAAAAQFIAPAGSGAGRPAAPLRQVPVTAAVRACPPSPGTRPGTVALIAAPPGTAAPASASGSGRAVLTPLPPAGTAPTAASRPVTAAGPGTLSLLAAPVAAGTRDAAAPPGVAVSASGAMARAMEAEQAEGPGLGSVRCGVPGSDTWFVGPGGQDGAARIRLVLMNVDALPATVSVSVITDAGPAQADGLDGISVPPRRTVTESLSALAGGGSTVAAVEVRTSAGRVAADVLDGPARGGTPGWLPAAAAPSRTLVIPGVPPSGSAAGLFLVVPGDTAAQVSVLAITPRGPYRPFGPQPLDLPGQSASYVALTPLGGVASALELTANVPVTAAAGVPGAFTAAAAPVSQQAVVAGNVSGFGLAADIVLSAPAAAARVRLTEIASGTTAAAQVVPVGGGHTVAVPVAAPRGSRRGAPFAVVITPLPGSGPVYAARVETKGQGVVASIIPAASAPATIVLPPVRGSYDAVYP
jgi:hypothetical protein